MYRRPSRGNLVFLSRIVIILLAISFNSATGNRQQLSSAIRPNTDEETQQQAALAVIRRLIADKADDVAIKVNFNLPGNYFKVRISAPSRPPEWSQWINFHFNEVLALFPSCSSGRSAKRITRMCCASKRRTVFRHAKLFITTWRTSVKRTSRGTATVCHRSTTFLPSTSRWERRASLFTTRTYAHTLTASRGGLGASGGSTSTGWRCQV